MQNPFKNWVFPEIVSLIKRKVHDKHDILHLIVESHLQKMQDNKFLEAYDWDQIVKELLIKFEVEGEIDVTTLVLKHAVPPKVYLLEDTMLKSLEMMKQRGYKLAAATNGYDKYQYPVLKALGLDTVFDDIITSDSAGYAKPNPAMLQSLKCQGDIVAHVGDRLDQDVVMANQLGVMSIFITRDLSEDIWDLPIEERKNHPGFHSFCEEKWHDENRLREANFYKKCRMPDLVIRSMEELALNMEVLIGK